MATETLIPRLDENTVEAPKAAYVKRTYSPEFLAEQAAIDKRVREEGARRIRRSVERLIALGFYDKDGNRIN